MTRLQENLQKHLANLAYPRHALKHPAEHEKANRYVQDTFRAYGYTVTAHSFPFEGKTYSNWIATLPGDPTDLPLTIVGAHFDSVPDCPGADDNASGVAVLLETARLYREKRLTDTRSQTTSVQFVAFDLEECGTVGSIAYAQRLVTEKRAVRGMLSLEMLGFITQANHSQRYPKGISLFYPHRGDFVGLIGSVLSFKVAWALRQAFKKIIGLKTETLLVPGKGRLVENIRRSDHAPFWDAGFPAVMVTDTSFYRNLNYHTPHDTIDTLNIPFMALVTEALTTFLTP